MPDQHKTPTREKIIKAAARMFSQSGYDKVTMREIAKASGINAASIYYHFPSKDDILKSLYRHYREEQRRESPDMGELLQLVETAPPHEVLMKTEFHFSEESRELLDQILVSAAREICADLESEQFIRECVFDSVDSILRPLLRRMLELKKIKPFDLDTFLRIVAYYCFSAAALNNSAFRQSVAEYQAGMAYIFTMITPTEE